MANAEASEMTLRIWGTFRGSFTCTHSWPRSSMLIMPRVHEWQKHTHTHTPLHNPNTAHQYTHTHSLTPQQIPNTAHQYTHTHTHTTNTHTTPTQTPNTAHQYTHTHTPLHTPNTAHSH